MNMLLRRHHPETQDERVLDPEQVPGPNGDNPDGGDKLGANADALEPALAALEAARAATADARTALEASPDDADLIAAVEAAEAVEFEAARLVQDIQTQGTDDGEQPEVVTAHGDLERPTRGASTDKWLAYATADPEADTNGLDLTPRTGLRDVIAVHYLGEAE